MLLNRQRKRSWLYYVVCARMLLTGPSGSTEVSTGLPLSMTYSVEQEEDRHGSIEDLVQSDRSFEKDPTYGRRVYQRYCSLMASA
jgi:hypothetical protein